MTYTSKMHEALRRDTIGKHNQVTDLLDEIERLQAELDEMRRPSINDAVEMPPLVDFLMYPERK